MESLSGASSSSSTSVQFVFFNDFEYEFVEEAERLSNWELLDVSDADFGMNGDRGEEEEEEICSGDGGVAEDLREMMITSATAVPISLVEERIADGRLGEVCLVRNQEDREDESDDGDDGDEFDLDDELVPWSVSDKLGRERMRKLGKRGFAKMYNSKRSPFLFTKAGCVRGKHGLGLKHSD